MPVQALHPVKRLQLFLPTFTGRLLLPVLHASLLLQLPLPIILVLNEQEPCAAHESFPIVPVFKLQAAKPPTLLPDVQERSPIVPL